MNCPNCQTQLSEGTQFCPSCGTKVNSEQENRPTVKYCPNCGNTLTNDVAFCPVCGTKADGAAGAANPYRSPVAKQPNPKFESFKSNLKLLFSNPVQAIDNELDDKNIFTALISAGVLLAAFVIMFMCIAGKADSEFGVDELYGLGIVAAILCAVFFMLVPAAAAQLSAKINGKSVNAISALSSNGLKTLYISAFIVITGFSALISIKIFAFMLLLTGMMNTFMSVSYINRVNGGALNSAKSLWSTYGIYALLKIIATGIVYGVLSSVIKDLLEEIVEDILFSSMF